VNSSEIDDQLSVDEDPDIIVTAEGEDLSSVVLEDVVDHHSEGEVVTRVTTGIRFVITEAKAIQLEEGGESSTEDTITSWSGSGVTPGVDLGEGDVLCDVVSVLCQCSVGPCVMVEGIVHVRVGDRRMGGARVQDGQSIRSQIDLRDSFVDSIISLKIRVALVSLCRAVDGVGQEASTELGIRTWPEVSELGLQSQSAGCHVSLHKEDDTA